MTLGRTLFLIVLLLIMVAGYYTEDLPLLVGVGFIYLGAIIQGVMPDETS